MAEVGAAIDTAGGSLATRYLTIAVLATAPR
jgi:hypothetical protein